MTLAGTTTAEIFGLGDTFPQPGWVVLDAARDHRYTGELVFDVLPAVQVYLDRGLIYLAERVNDPTLGSRLVDAGALNAVQLDQGALRIGDNEHLGRLFERVPSVDRHAVLVITEMMNDECVAWLARQTVRDVRATPYQHHASGVHRWNRPIDAIDLVPGEPLPAPAVAAEPVQITPPEPFAAPDDDDVVQWNEPAWFEQTLGSYRPTDDATPPDPSPSPAPTQPNAGPVDDEFVVSIDDTEVQPLSIDADWLDRLIDHGLPDTPNPLTPSAQLPARPTASTDRFELIWPSGQVDDFQTDVSVEPGTDPDHDRVGPTARVTSPSLSDIRRPMPRPEAPTATGNAEAATEQIDIWGGADGATQSWQDAITEPTSTVSSETAAEPVVETRDEAADADGLAVRRAVASIETGSLAARRRMAGDSGADAASRGTAVAPSGPVTVSDEPIVRNAMGIGPVRSVFDDDPIEPAVVTRPVEPVAAQPAPDEPTRQSALRRLISGLRRSDVEES